MAALTPSQVPGKEDEQRDSHTAGCTQGRGVLWVSQAEAPWGGSSQLDRVPGVSAGRGLGLSLLEDGEDTLRTGLESLPQGVKGQGLKHEWPASPGAASVHLETGGGGGVRTEAGLGSIPLAALRGDSLQ